ncbi:MAG: class I SAM-dependent methyltransferase [Acidobacteriaceae bacterium]
MSSKEHTQAPFPRSESRTTATDQQDRARWNQIYNERSHTTLEPDDSFVAIYQRFIGPRFARRSPKRALDIAGGVGRNALFLAREGWQVTLNELSDEAAHLAEANAAREGLRLTVSRASALEALSPGDLRTGDLSPGDLRTGDLSPGALRPGALNQAGQPNTRYDLLLMLFYLDRALFPLLPAALAPGGMLFIKTRTEDHPRFHSGSHHPEYFLRPGELDTSFPGLRMLHSREAAGMAELLSVWEDVPA